jgi:hypothetical protein
VEFVAICLISRKATKDCAVGTHRVHQENKKNGASAPLSDRTAKAQK